MLKAIIVDDEQESINALRIKLSECDTMVDIIETTTDSRKVLSLLVQYQIDILFLDIEMPGLNGLDLLEMIEDRSFEVILVTAYSAYALKAIKASAFDYLLKPVDIDELQLALDKVTKKQNKTWQHPDIVRQLSGLSEILQHVSPKPTKIALSSVSETYYIAPEEIVYISGENNYSSFYLMDGREIVVSKTLKEFEDLLCTHQFFRAHKSYLINLNYIKKLNKGLELSVTMSNDTIIEISYRKKPVFLKIMKDYTNS